MHLPGRSLVCALLSASAVGAGASYLHNNLTETRLFVQAAADAEPGYIRAGIPFIVRDNYATLLCISTHAGHPLPPFIFSGRWTRQYQSGEAPAHVDAGIPFTVRDSEGVQFCISTRSGQPLPPFISAK